MLLREFFCIFIFSVLSKFFHLFHVYSLLFSLSYVVGASHASVTVN